MFSPTLAVAAALSFAVAACYLGVARAVNARPAESGRLAKRMFALWWLSLALIETLRGATATLGALEAASAPLAATARYATLAILCSGLAGFLYYVAYLYAPWERALLVVGASYVAVYATATSVLTPNQPESLSVSTWDVALVNRAEITPAWEATLVLALVVPLLAAVLAYASLYARLPERAQRRRVALVSSSVVLWVGSALLAIYGTAPLATTGRLVVGPLAALLALMAYLPRRRVVALEGSGAR